MRIIKRSVLIIFLALVQNCVSYKNSMEFINNYSNEDFSQFTRVEMSLRGIDKQGNFVVFGYAPDFVNDSSKLGYYIVRLDKQNYRVTEMKWTLTEENINADTLKLQQLARKFLGYEILHLSVDKQGNVFFGLKSNERPDLIRVADKEDLPKGYEKWKNVKGNWYEQ